MSTESTLTKEALAKVAQGFRIYGSLLESHPYGSGHINDTLALTFSQSGTRSRFEKLRSMVEADPHGRLAGARKECEFLLERELLVDVLLDLQKKGEIPERITHNDTKLNNVMIDDATETGICVIDLAP
jgi:hypothetical protein